MPAAIHARQIAYFARILGRSLTEPLPFLEELLAKEYHPVMARFGQALRGHPNLTPEYFLWRLSFLIGAMHHALATLHRMKDLTRGICRNRIFRPSAVWVSW